MPRRKNPYATFALLLFVLGFGYAAYYFLYVERIFVSKEEAAIPQAQLDRLRKTVDEGLSSEETYQGLAGFNWRGQTKRYRVDVNLADGATIPLAKRLAGKVNDLVQRASDGSPAEVSFLVLGREIYHYVP